jgi:hypothetical protein
LQARGDGPFSQGTSACTSQTQKVSSQRSHFTVIRVELSAAKKDPG